MWDGERSAGTTIMATPPARGLAHFACMFAQAITQVCADVALGGLLA